MARKLTPPMKVARKLTPPMKRCANLLRNLMYVNLVVVAAVGCCVCESARRWNLHSHRSQDTAFVFNEPVDPVKHGCLNYPEVIKQPMDLGTIKRKLEANTYQGSIEAFAADVRLVRVLDVPFRVCRPFV